MKVKRVLANNRKKAFLINAGKSSYEFPYSELSIKPTTVNPVVSVFVDKEIASEGFTYVLKSGRQDTVLLDQILEKNGDAEYERRKILYDLTCIAQEAIDNSSIKKRALARKLSTTPTHLYRLLDQSFYGKTIDQMLKLLVALGVFIKFKKVA